MMATTDEIVRGQRIAAQIFAEPEWKNADAAAQYAEFLRRLPMIEEYP